MHVLTNDCNQNGITDPWRALQFVHNCSA